MHSLTNSIRRRPPCARLLAHRHCSVSTSTYSSLPPNNSLQTQFFYDKPKFIVAETFNTISVHSFFKSAVLEAEAIQRESDWIRHQEMSMTDIGRGERAWLTSVAGKRAWVRCVAGKRAWVKVAAVAGGRGVMLYFRWKKSDCWWILTSAGRGFSSSATEFWDLRTSEREDVSYKKVEMDETRNKIDSKNHTRERNSTHPVTPLSRNTHSSIVQVLPVHVTARRLSQLCDKQSRLTWSGTDEADRYKAKKGHKHQTGIHLRL